MKVEQFNGAKNQFIIYGEDGVYLQSYNSIIVFRPFNGKIQLDKYYWDYSKTTAKYRNKFLWETKKETQEKIDSGEYILTNLNK